MIHSRSDSHRDYRSDHDIVLMAIEGIPDEPILDESSEHSTRSPGEPTATRSNNR